MAETESRFSITYTSSKHIEEIMSNGGLKHLAKEWTDLLSKPMEAVLLDRTIVIRARTRKTRR